MLHSPVLRLIVVLTVMQLPMMAMNGDNPTHKILYGGIYKIVVGTSDGDTALYNAGIDYVRNQQTHLKSMTFGSFRLMPFVERNLLKALVVHKEKALLSDFLDMYQRSYPRSPDGINFSYKLEKNDEKPREIIDYTLLDVAFAVYCQAVEEKKISQDDVDILSLLVDQGGELKVYRDHSEVISEIVHRKKRFRKADDVGGLPEAAPSGCTLPPNRPAPRIPADVGPLLDIQEIQDSGNIELESGFAVSFILDDSK